MNPLLIIGVGGSGGKTIRSMKEAISHKLIFNGYDGGIPSAWQFLQVDTTYDGQDFNAKMLPQDEVCLVVPQGATFGSILNGIEARANSIEDTQEMLAGWGIPQSNMAVNKGAGMIRGIGRQVGIAEAKRIQGSLDSAISKMMSPSATSELRKVADHLKIDPKVVSSEPSVILITSLSGGSGAGMFMDVAEILKRTHRDKSWAQNIVSFLYTAEVFEGVPGAGDVRQNCLGAMNEIVAGRYQQPSSRTNRLMEKMAINEANPDIHFTGCQGNILIGSRNSSGVNLAQDASGVGMNEVFTTVGEMLAGIFTDPAISDWVYKIAFVNAVLGTKVKDESGMSSNDPSTVLAFASMGFARLSLGIDRVSRYMTDALTRAQVERLLFPENLTPEQLSNQTKEEFLSAKVVFAWDAFLAKSKLNERKEKNDVTDALVNKDALAKHLDAVLKTSMSSLDGLTKPEKIEKVAARLWNDFEIAREELKESVRADQKRMAGEWARSIQVSLTNHVADTIARSGLQFAIELLAMLSQEVKQVADKDLKGEVDHLKGKLSRVTKESWASKVLEHAGGRQGLSREDRDVRAKLEEYITNVSKGIEEEYRKQLAIELMRELAADFIDALHKRLIAERQLLLARASSRNPEDNNGIVLNSMPGIGSGNPVPKGYQPRAIEKILIEPSKFLEFYLEYAKADIKDESDKADAFNTSARDALLRVPLTKDATSPDQSLLTASPWMPRTLDSVASREVEFEIKTNFWDLKDANESWLASKGSQFEKVKNMSIADYCKAGGDRVREKERQDAFIKAYTEMMMISVPLVKYNEKALKSLKGPSGGGITATQKKSPAIPFDINSPVGSSLIGVLKQNMEIDTADPSFAKQWFDPASRVNEMYAIQVPSGAMPAYAFASLTNPIAESVLDNKNSAILWSSYWTNRRSRPFQESIPVSDKMLKSMVTGWFVAKAFDLVSKEKEGIEEVVKIQNPTLSVPGNSLFPSPLLVVSQEDVRNSFQLPSILMSMGLAIVNYGQTGDESNLHAYRLLKFLGREVTVNRRTDEWDNGGLGELLPSGQTGQSSVLKDWVLTGTIAGLSGYVPPAHLAQSTDSSSARAESLLRYLENQSEKFDQYWETTRTTKWQDLPNLWEIRGEISGALANIIDYVKSISETKNQGLDG
jgi:hypothetical protein